jgi:hypothetical protein
MAYGERGTIVDEKTLKRVFTDAMRRQLERILSDQLDGGDAEHHRLVNRLYAELWRLYSRQGPGALYTADEDERLAAASWSKDERMVLADLWERSRHGETTISARQIDDYAERFDIARTTSNLDRLRRVIYGARAEACDEATRRLGTDGSAFRFDQWAEEALVVDDEPLTPPSAPWNAEPIASGDAPSAAQAPPSPTAEPPVPAPQGPPKKALAEATEECIAAYTRAKAWSTNTCKQVHAVSAGAASPATCSLPLHHQVDAARESANRGRIDR